MNFREVASTSAPGPSPVARRCHARRPSDVSQALAGTSEVCIDAGVGQLRAVGWNGADLPVFDVTLPSDGDLRTTLLSWSLDPSRQPRAEPRVVITGKLAPLVSEALACGATVLSRAEDGTLTGTARADEQERAVRGDGAEAPPAPEPPLQLTEERYADLLLITDGEDHGGDADRFARRAEAEGLVVIDSPGSILRCTNKVFQAEAFARHGIPCPRTVILHRGRPADGLESLGFPVVLKRPDSSFSLGVVKANRVDELESRLAEVFENSELAIAQEFVPSAYDWRIGVLDNQPLYACRYHMANHHWQIINKEAGSRGRYGKVETLDLDAVPRGVLRCAVRSARLMGRGLYGVDLKTVGRKSYLIEVNDNPSIDAGYEDAVLGAKLYGRIMEWFLERLEERAR